MTDNNPIKPIDFTPHEVKESLFSFRLNWWHGAVIGVVLLAAPALFFVLTARSVYVEADPITAAIEIDGGFSIRLGQRYLIRTGTYQITLSNEGYHDTITELQVSEQQAQTHPFILRKLPGVINITTNATTTELSGARVQIDGIDIGPTPLQAALIEPGTRQMRVSLERYLDHGSEIVIEGRSVEQSFTVNLQPAWAIVSLSTEPPGAEVLVDGEQVTGTTPLNLELLQGERNIMLKLSDHKAWQYSLDIIAGEDITLDLIQLEPADGLLFIRSTPGDAGVIIRRNISNGCSQPAPNNTTDDGEFQGLTPLEVALPPDQNHELRFFKNGYQSKCTTVRITSGQERELNMNLHPILASVTIAANPPDANLFINGEPHGTASQVIELMAATQQIEIRKEGYVPYTTEFTPRPGLEQAIRVTLKSEEQARLEQIKPLITTAAGQELKLFYPGAFTMGASRRESGRRPNEIMRDIKLERAFYFGLREISNAEYRLFDAAHNSGTISGSTLNNESQPVVRISWHQAARYCNWLSAQESLEPFYVISGTEVTGTNPDSTGYRLPTEAEWAWVARTDDSGNSLKYPWGNLLPPPENAGNFADVTAQRFLANILLDYNDHYFATAPVASFTPNHHGVYDMAGNIAEWINDFYGTAGNPGNTEVDPLGPDTGQFHIIRGSSWSHGTVTELRLSFRDYGTDPREDLGFRIARYLEN
ncbi:MAG: PEGA domain-containing protein [Pseudohongiellaceae bacterium]